MCPSGRPGIGPAGGRVRRRRLTLNGYRALLRGTVAPAEDVTLEPTPTPRYWKITGAAAAIAREMGHEHIGVEHLFLAMLADPRAVPTQVLSQRVDLNQVEAELRALMASEEYLTPSTRFIEPE